MKNDYQIYYPAALTISSWDDDGFHDTMLRDFERLEKYEQAIESAVKPGMIVLDLGTGTGILAKYTLEADAARVYGIEEVESVLAKARANLRTYKDRFIPILGSSFRVGLPEKVDLIVSEIIGNFGDNENCTEILNDAFHRFLKPGGQMLPQKISSWAVPVFAPEANKNIDGVIFSRGNGRIVKERSDYYETSIPESDYLSLPQTV